MAPESALVAHVRTHARTAARQVSPADAVHVWRGPRVGSRGWQRGTWRDPCGTCRPSVAPARCAASLPSSPAGSTLLDSTPLSCLELPHPCTHTHTQQARRRARAQVHAVECAGRESRTRCATHFACAKERRSEQPQRRRGVPAVPFSTGPWSRPSGQKTGGGRGRWVEEEEGVDRRDSPGGAKTLGAYHGEGGPEISRVCVRGVFRRRRALGLSGCAALGRIGRRGVRACTVPPPSPASAHRRRAQAHTHHGHSVLQSAHFGEHLLGEASYVQPRAAPSGGDAPALAKATFPRPL